jgi:two-component system nitrate/nitrite response regulator NarL
MNADVLRADSAFEIRIAIVEDQSIFRAGLCHLLRSAPGIRMVGEAASAAGVVELVRDTQPDVLLLDYAMPAGGALKVLEDLRDARLVTRAVILTAGMGREAAREVLRLGARGILLKSCATDLLFRCIRAIVEGQYWIDNATTADLVHALQLHDPRMHDPQPYDEQMHAETCAVSSISETDRRVLAALARGASNKVIARELGIAEQTVKNHLSRLFERLQAANRVELVLRARRQGLIAHE